MELTWVAILASLAMGLAAACIFIFAVKKDYFRDIEDAKYQVFWSDLEVDDSVHPSRKLVDSTPKENGNASGKDESR